MSPRRERASSATAKYGAPAGRLRDEWRARAAEHGLDRFRLRRVLGQPPRRVVHDDLATERLARRLEGPQGLTRAQSRFTRRDVLQAFAEAARDGTRVEQLEHRATAFLARPEIVALPDDGGERRFTTRELLSIERELLTGAAARRGGDTGLADPHAVKFAIEARPTLSAEQRERVESVTCSGDGVQVVRAA